MTAQKNWSRRDLLRGTLLAGGALAVPGLLAACSKTPDTGAGNTLDRIKKDGKVKVGFAAEAPYGFEQDGKLAGEAPAIAAEVYKALGVGEMEGVLVEFGQLIPALTSGQFDAVAAGMFITPERCGQAAFAEPEYISTAGLLVPKGNPKGLTDYKSVAEAGIKLAVMSGAAEAANAKDAGVSEDNLVTVDKQPDGLSAILAGDADAFTLTTPSLRWMAKDSADVEVTEGFVPTLKGVPQTGAGAAVFRSADTSLLEAFNAELAKLKADSARYLALIEPFGFTQAEIPPADLTTAELCKG
ncbi:ectoine/hydroxyectoine ABC transporter substrate-binding protein EhuB [Phytomonospora endophytica]|uniref:Polar amino acid transport system substrate-binding protein n=1 Tax=Phytomonospora endophytica TaxID=714109 RepID=A0A841FMF5_9ACTN|nr:ectoine/hydroxyectoine ABC transporter substrate-binding protein EhuB [Phytomonospora endophytica]MBB6033130.1 polar amino acid transport system substrate-binding protein [Phytomonospora endophytica]GIG65356.1 ectoine/hydroxyectoine ABC transporter substrate-binding protein EhuB [Phytomonospora endophytica]